MPSIGIIGIKIGAYKLPEILRKIIFSKNNFEINTSRYTWRNLNLSNDYHNLKLKQYNLKLNIYKIIYNNEDSNEIELNFYLDSYKDHINDDIYIVYKAMNSDKNNYYDNYFDYDDINNFSEWIKCLKKLKINCHNSGFYIVEQ